MKKQSKGITLISLIITIIILLILAGISLAEFTGYGLFAQAQRAKLEEKRSTITEWLSIKLIEEQANNPSGTAEEIIGATRENVINHQNELEKMGKDINIEEISNEENGEEVEAYFYVIVDEDVYKVELEGVKFIGRKDEFPPIIKITEVTSTTDTITVTVETQRNEEGKIEYWIKAEDEEEYRKIGETEGEGKSYTYEGLIQNKKYNIKVIAIAKNKKTAETTANGTTGNVPDLTDADITFAYDPAEWTNGSVKVTASANIDITGYTLKLSTDLKIWSNSVTRTTNGKVYAKLSDNTNQYGDKYATGNVTNIDTTKPVVTGATATTNSIAITATDEASGIVGYAVTTSNTTPTSFTSCTSTKSLSATVSGKTQGTTYYVWVKDAAGNVSASKSTATGNVPDLTDADIKFTYTPTGWTNGNVKVTASANIDITGYTLKLSTDLNTWSNSVTRTTNGKVYAKLSDNTNQYGDKYATGNVTNIDTMEPTIGSVTGVTIVSGNTGTITVSDIVDTGGSGLNAYYISTSSEAPSVNTSGWVTNTASSFTKAVTEAGTYYVWVKDNAGNISDVRNCTVTVQTAVAQIGSTYYASVANAVSATTNKATTIKLLVNRTEEVTIPSGKNITFNLNGKTLTGSITNKGTINLLGGTIVNNSNSNTITNTGTFNFNSGTITKNVSGGHTVYNTGTFNFKGGTISLYNAVDATALYSKGTVNMSGGTITSNAFGLVIDAGAGNITGGTIQSTGKYNALLIRYQGRAAAINATIKSSGTASAICNQVGLEGCVIRSRASNYGISGRIDGVVLATSNVNAGKSEEVITIYNTAHSNIQFATWTEKNDQDDLKWHLPTYYDSSTGTAHTTIKKSEHNNETGTYFIHIYGYNSSGTYEYISGIAMNF